VGNFVEMENIQMNTIAIRLFAPVMALSTAMLCGACSGPSPEAIAADSAELARLDTTPGLEKVDHAAFGDARSEGAKGAGVYKWRLGQVGKVVVVDGLNAKGGIAFQFRVSTVKATTTIATSAGNVLALDGKGQVVKMTLTKIEQKLFAAAAADLDKNSAAEMQVAYLSWGGFWKAATAALACAAAAVEVGVNPAADAACVISAGDVITSKED
jgi:hypothetical protein